MCQCMLANSTGIRWPFSPQGCVGAWPGIGCSLCRGACSCSGFESKRPLDKLLLWIRISKHNLSKLPFSPTSTPGGMPGPHQLHPGASGHCAPFRRNPRTPHTTMFDCRQRHQCNQKLRIEPTRRIQLNRPNYSTDMLLTCSQKVHPLSPNALYVCVRDCNLTNYHDIPHCVTHNISRYVAPC